MSIKISIHGLREEPDGLIDADELDTANISIHGLREEPDSINSGFYSC